MASLYPLVFEPRFKERVWGGRRLEARYGKRLPAGVPIGESWEISDRPGDESVIANGPLAGRTLRWLMEERRTDLLGDAAATDEGRFPLLCKLLDARETLSLQVHPPAAARHLGDPKTEMWYVAEAASGAELFVGLRRGVTRERFEAAIRNGGIADCLHRVHVAAGDAMFLPSGRVHAIGAGLLIFEIQQNSDTTFRVYDWDRAGLDGRPRELHVPESLASIDFNDVEPGLVDTPTSGSHVQVRPLVRDPLFEVSSVSTDSPTRIPPPSARPQILACIRGTLTVSGAGESCDLEPGDFCVLPAMVDAPVVEVAAAATLLVAEPGLTPRHT